MAEALETYASLTTSEGEDLEDLALVSLLEREELGTLALTSELEVEKIETFALDSLVELIRFDSFGTIIFPERVGFGGWAGNSNFEDTLYGTCGLSSDLVYYQVPIQEVPLHEPLITDHRSGGAVYPVVKTLLTLTVPEGDEAIATTLYLNSLIRMATVYVPDLGGDTANLAVIDEIGGIIYGSGVLNDNQITTLGTDSGYLFPMAGEVTIQIALSGPAAEDEVISIMLYGV